MENGLYLPVPAGLTTDEIITSIVPSLVHFLPENVYPISIRLRNLHHKRCRYYLTSHQPIKRAKRKIYMRASR